MGFQVVVEQSRTQPRVVERRGIAVATREEDRHGGAATIDQMCIAVSTGDGHQRGFQFNRHEHSEIAPVSPGCRATYRARVLVSPGRGSVHRRSITSGGVRLCRGRGKYRVTHYAAREWRLSGGAIPKSVFLASRRAATRRRKLRLEPREPPRAPHAAQSDRFAHLRAADRGEKFRIVAHR